MQPESDGRRILVLSDMGEMGEEALHYHTALAQDINDSRIAMFLSIGDHCKALDQLIDDRITHQHFESVTSLEKFLQVMGACSRSTTYLLKPLAQRSSIFSE